MRMHRTARFILLAALAIACGANAGEVAVRDEIFGNREAAEMVLKARACDPAFARSGSANREQAVSLYEQAMALQPGAKINAALAARIASLYAYYENDAEDAHPVLPEAARWWKRCTRETDRKQLLWGQAHVGLACALFLSGEAHKAVEAYEATLELDAEGIEWPRWKVKPDTRTESGKQGVDAELRRIRKTAREFRVKAIDNIHYALVRVDGARALTTLLALAEEHKGTDVGARASQLAAKLMKGPRASPYRYKDLDSPGQAKPPEPSEGPASHESAGVTATAKEPTPSSATPAAEARRRREQAGGAHSPALPSGPSSRVLAALAAVGAGMIVVVVLLVLRARSARRGP